MVLSMVMGSALTHGHAVTMVGRHMVTGRAFRAAQNPAFRAGPENARAFSNLKKMRVF